MVQLRKHAVVIVEDEGLIAEDIRRQLLGSGYHVAGVADSGPEALRVIRSTAPDVVLMDIRIKGAEDGIGVAQRVRDDLDVPVVFLTAYEDPQTLARASAAQPYGYLRKPISGASLRGSIEIAIAKHRHDSVVREQRDWAMSNFGAVPYGILLTDVAGRVSWLNPVAEELTGQTASSCLNRHWSQVLRLFHVESGQPADDLVAVAILTGETIGLPADVMLARSEQKESLPIAGTVAPTSKGTRARGAVIAFEDATWARFEAEQRLLTKNHSALRRLVENVAHRFASLRPVDAASDTMLLANALNPPARLRESVKKVHGAVMDTFSLGCRLSALLKSRDVHLDRVALNELLSQLAVEVRPKTGDLEVKVSPDPVYVHADAINLKSSLLTFVESGLSQMREGERLVIDVSHPEMKEMRHWVRIRLTYPSSEPLADLERVFEPTGQDTAQDPYVAYEFITNMGGLLMARMGVAGRIAVEIYLQQVSAAAVGRSRRFWEPDLSVRGR